MISTTCLTRRFSRSAYGLAVLITFLLVPGLPTAVAGDTDKQSTPHDAREAIGIDEGNYWDETALTSYAQLLASRPFREPPPLPRSFEALTYDSYRKIAFDPTKTIWRDTSEPFQLELYHRGYIYPEQVRLFMIEPEASDAAGLSARVRAMPFDRSLFTYRGDASGLLHDPEYGTAKGYAGIKIIGNVPSSEWMQEVFSFIGSSYFRGMADGQTYGTSCRGLAINIGMDDAEEFPAFRSFWLEKPTSKTQKSFTVHALLDSESATGAYRFDITPGTETVCDVTARLFFRRVPEKVGFAPLSSMWMWGQGLKGPKDDHRPEVHDADGLLVHADSAWMWRPLSRQPYPSVSGMNATRIQGFGLMQRQRDEAAYNDPEARYVDRPSIWIEPLAGWTPGRVELLEFPTRFEGMDNIAAWYVPFGLFPGRQADPLRPVGVAYRVTIGNDDPPAHTLAKTADFQITMADGRDRQLVVIGDETIEPDTETLPDAEGRSQVKKARASAAGDASTKKTQVQIDFTGSSLDSLDLADIKPQVDGIRARIEDVEIVDLNAAAEPSKKDAEDGKQTDNETNNKQSKKQPRNGNNDERTIRGQRTIRLTFTAVPETDYSFELRATLFGVFPSPAAKPSGDAASEDEATPAAADAGVTRPLSETWSYLCPPQL